MQKTVMKKTAKSVRSYFNLAANDNLTPDGLKRALNPPHDNTEENLHGTPVKDPFRPLENLSAKETTEWAARENKRFEDYMADLPAKDFEAKAIAFFDKARAQGERESMPTRYGDKYFVYRKSPNDERWVLYIKDTPDYGAPARLVLDPMKLDPSGKTNLVGINISGDGKTLAYRLSVSGSDKETLRFMDIETGKDLDLVYTNMRTAVSWNGSGGFYYNTRNPDKSSDVRYHTMGTAVDQDVTVFATGEPEAGASFFRLAKDSQNLLGAYEYVNAGGTKPGNSGLLFRPVGSTEKFRTLFSQKGGTVSPIHEIGGKIYAETSVGAPNNKLVCIDPNDPAPAKWQTIIPQNKDDQLTDVRVWQNKLFATYKHDTGEVLKVFDLQGKYLYDVPIPPLSTFTMGSYSFNDTTCLIAYDNFQESGNIYKYDATTNQLTLHKKSDVPIDLKDCIVERIYATSKDGTKVPMTVIRDPKTKLDGTAAVKLYGYGGFNSGLKPGFSSGIAQWVRAGGIYVQANLRGGDEYGLKWYNGGRRENKQNVFDDFAACAEHLIKTNYTTNKRLAIEGGSNGGLLTLATMIQHPDLFGAVISSVPVTDMFRFHLGSYYGYSWKSDYGDPGIKKDFNIAAKYSPLHNVPQDFKHPPLLIKTDANDDRVLPWHSYKMAATMQAKEDKSSVTYLKVRTDGGHSAGMTEKQWATDVAGVNAFLNKVLGPINQDDYKAQMAAEQKKTARNAPVRVPLKKAA
jgi:prolyl oligopeptidase